MPRLNDANLDMHKLPTGSYGYSAVKMQDLAATEYTLVTIVNDVSGSVSDYKKDMEKALGEIISACKYNPRADNLMIRLVNFNDILSEFHGFKLLSQCSPSDYDGCLTPNGMTALFDASENAIMATYDYAKQLSDADFCVNAIIFVITDGDDNSSASTAKDVAKALGKAVKDEKLESVVSVLIGVGAAQNANLAVFLEDFNKKAGFTQYIPLADANKRILAKLAEFVSESIRSQSQSLGTGVASKQMPSLII